MNTDPLLGCRIKIERAKKHLSDLEAAIKSFGERQPYLIIPETELNTRHEVYRISISEPIPVEWGAVVGDCVHNLRSSLDMLANYLVVNGKGTPTDKTAFPIGRSRSNLDGRISTELKGASSAAIKLVKRLKPYGGSNGFKLLHQMHRLDIEDKHRALIPVLGAHAETLMTIWAGPKDSGGVSATWSLKPKGEFPLTDGSELQRYGRGPLDDDQTEFKFVIEVTFDKGQVFDGQAVVPVLNKLIDITERIIKIFALRIFKVTF